MIEAPHIGNMLAAYTRAHRLYQSGWARQAGVTVQTVKRYLKQPSMKVDTLFTICQTLEHNFLREIADALPASIRQAPVDQTTEIAALQKTIANLELQVDTLKQALEIVGRRG